MDSVKWYSALSDNSGTENALSPETVAVEGEMSDFNSDFPASVPLVFYEQEWRFLLEN